MSSSAKRQRRSNNGHHLRRDVEREIDDEFVAGNIVEVELHNFMTYDYIRFHPSPRLNLLIGPNGSGKSSLVCALGLALGADPNVLGRASSVGAFVKRGQDSASVKVILRGHSAAHRIHITRKIDTANNSTWILNGSTVPKRDILEVIHNFNIQVNNLTQFLPQDRVCEFAKLTPIQLLEETEKAVGDAELPVLHSRLIDKSRQLKKLEIAVKQIGDSLTQLEELNAEQEKDVGRVLKRKKLLEKVELMKKKLPWLIYDMKKMEFLEVQNLEKEAKRKLDEAAKLLNELSKPIEELKQAKSSEEASCKKINNQTSRNAGKRMELLELEGHLSVQVHAKYTEIEEMKKREASWQQQMTKATEDLTAAETELSNLPFYEPPKDEIDKLNIQISEVQLAVNQKALQKRDLEDVQNQRQNSLRKCTDRLRELDNKNMKLLQALRSSGVDKIFEAYEWLQAHRNEFKKEVFGPVLLEVNVKEQRHTAFLENAVPFYIWKSVVTQDPADRDLIVRNLRSFDIPVLNFVSNGAPERAPYEVPSELHELGIYKRLDQTFDAPSAVREILTSQSAIADSYVGTQETDRRADELSKLGIMDFWTPESHYRWSSSRYSGNISASVDPVYPSRLFTYSSDIGDVEIIKAQKTELEDAIAEAEKHLKKLQFEQRQLEDNLAVLRKEQDEIVNTVRLEKKKRREMENRIDQRRRKLESMKKEEDLDTNIKKLLNQVSQLNARRFQTAIQIKDLLVEAVAYKWSFAAKHMKSLEIELQVAELEANLKQHQKIAIQASTHLEQCKIETENHRQHLASAKRQAEFIAIITEDLAEEFCKMPTTVEELEAAIQDNTSQANSILFVNQNILEEYETRQKKIEEMKGRLETDRMELKRCLSDIEATKDKWLPKLRELVAKINETFSNNFREMAVAGEVSLDEHDMDFDKYGILIKVKFRQSGQLQVLSAHHQSGGERSVSTILYLVSLQDLTNCPFRVVDEINQGMDLVNERKMFQQLVRAASQLTTPQCFLLTPKLLDNLEYGEACTVLNIMNGPWIKPASEAWKDQSCFRNITGMKRQIQT